VSWTDTRVTLVLEPINGQGAEEEKAFVPCSSARILLVLRKYPTRGILPSLPFISEESRNRLESDATKLAVASSHDYLTAD
jgi:hypothetical protein